MIVHCWLLILVVVNPKSLVVKALVQDIRNLIVKGKCCENARLEQWKLNKVFFTSIEFVLSASKVKMSQKKLVIITDGYSPSYKSLLNSLKITKVDLVLVKNYKCVNTTETLKVPMEKLLDKIMEFKTNSTSSCLKDGLRRAISLLVNDFGEILILSKTIPLMRDDLQEPFDNLQIGNNLQDIGSFLKKSGIQVSLISTLLGFTLLEKWVDFVNATQDYSPVASGLVVKLTPFLAKVMMENTSAQNTLPSGVSTPTSVMVAPTNISDASNPSTPGGSNASNLAFLLGQMQAYQQHVAKNQSMLPSLEEEARSMNALWSGVLSWKGIDPNTNQTREISCQVMALPVHKRDLADYSLNLWPSKLVMASVLPLQTEYLQAHVKASNLALVKIVPIPTYPNAPQASFSNLLNILSTRKVASLVRFSGDTGLLMVENAGKLIAVVCVQVGLSVVSKG